MDRIDPDSWVRPDQRETWHSVSGSGACPVVLEAHTENPPPRRGHPMTTPLSLCQELLFFGLAALSLESAQESLSPEGPGGGAA